MGPWRLSPGTKGPGSYAMRFPGFRRLTRDSQNRRLTRDSRIPDFFRKKLRKNRKNRFLGLPGPKSNFEFFMIFYMPGISYKNPYFLAPSPLKPLNSNPRY